MMGLRIVENSSKWTIQFYQNKKSDHEIVAIKTLSSIQVDTLTLCTIYDIRYNKY